MLCEPVQRREKILSAGVEVMLRGEAIAYSHHNCLSRARHAATNRVVRIEIANHESAAMAPEETGLEPGRPFRRVDAQYNRAAGSVDSVLDNGSDRDTTPVRRRQQAPGAAKFADLLAANGLAGKWGYEAQKQPRLSVESAGTQSGRHARARHLRDLHTYGI